MINYYSQLEVFFKYFVVKFLSFLNWYVFIAQNNYKNPIDVIQCSATKTYFKDLFIYKWTFFIWDLFGCIKLTFENFNAACKSCYKNRNNKN